MACHTLLKTAMNEQMRKTKIRKMRSLSRLLKARHVHILRTMNNEFSSYYDLIGCVQTELANTPPK